MRSDGTVLYSAVRWEDKWVITSREPEPVWKFECRYQRSPLLISEDSTSPASFQGFQTHSCCTWVLSCQGDARAQPATQNVCFDHFYPVLQMSPLQPPSLLYPSGGINCSILSQALIMFESTEEQRTN